MNGVQGMRLEGAVGAQHALDPPGQHERGAYSWDGQQIAFASDRGVQQRPTTLEEMTPQGPNVQGMVVNLFVMNANDDQGRSHGPFFE
jgi:Tol biopolymer transport system component